MMLLISVCIIIFIVIIISNAETRVTLS